MLGSGLLKGLAETARNLVGSYVEERRLTTVAYPEERLPQVPNARVFPFLVYDGDDPMKGLRCVACLICEKECPPQCISIVKDTVKKPDAAGKLQFQPKVFNLDISVCMSCQICVEVCPFDAIEMDTAFELSTSDRFGGLLLRKEQLAKPNSYFHQIHADDAAAVDVRLHAQLAQTRPGASVASSSSSQPK
jgi:NADH-quinone oxidoreductase subunit I